MNIPAPKKYFPGINTAEAVTDDRYLAFVPVHQRFHQLSHSVDGKTAGAQVAPRIRFAPGDLIAFERVPTEWYVRLDVDDRPGVLAQIAGAFGDAGVSIRSGWQEGRGSGATLIIVTHRAVESHQREAASMLRDLDAVRSVASVIRVESEDA